MLKPCLLIAMSAIVLPAAARADTPVPGWQDLETAYAHDGNVDGAQRQFNAAIPAGSPTPRAVAALGTVGAACKPVRSGQAAERCLIHQYSLADGAADDVRWTVLLHTTAGNVSSISLQRYVDRHGSN